MNNNIKESVFLIPNYLFEEIAEYLETTAKGKCKFSKWNNIQALLRLAVVNDRITEEEAKYIKEKYCRED